MNIGKKLRELRGDRGRDEVAEKVGISSSALGMYECNKRVPRDNIKKKLAEFYGVPIQQLFFDE
jgi:transcriptional regulator with XRE-family HTH domain